jgi:arylsulfatase A-like enzyme
MEAMKLNRRQTLAGAAALGFAELCPASVAPANVGTDQEVTATKRPKNIFCFVADDFGKEGLDIYPDAENVLFPSMVLDTPNLTAFCADARVFDNFIVTPICLPTRIAYATGALPTTSNQLIYRSYAGVDTCRKHENTLYHHLKTLGMVTASFGKWHLSYNLEKCRSQPHAIGIDDYLINLSNSRSNTSATDRLWGAQMITEAHGDGVKLEPTIFAEDYLSDACCEFIRRNRDRPFYIQYWSGLPHRPFEVTPKNSDRGEVLTDKEKFVGMISYLDLVFGKLIDTLRSEGLLDDTLVLFFSDNGGPGPMEGGKGQVSEAGVTVPFAIRYPGVVQPGREKRLASVVDLLPTLSDILGSMRKSPDGVSIVDLMHDGEALPRKYAASIAYEDVWMVRDERYKLVVDHSCRKRLEKCRNLYLIDLLEDPHERNLIEYDRLTPAQSEHFHRLLGEARVMGLTIHWKQPGTTWFKRLRNFLKW